MKLSGAPLGLALALGSCAGDRLASLAAPTRVPLPISIVNGSFEADDWGIGKRFDLGASGGPVTGWTVVDPTGDSLYPWGLREGINQHGGGPTPFGQQWFVIGGPFGAGGISIEQSVGGLTVGQTYALGFALSTEEFTGGSSNVRVSFPSGTSTPGLDIAVPPSALALWDTWTSYSIDVVADAPTLTVRFTDLGSPLGRDVGLDNVTLVGRGIDLSIDPLRLAQVVFDPDIDTDGRVDLVARKGAVAIATVRASGASPGDATPVLVQLRLGTQVRTASLPLGRIPPGGADVELFFRTPAAGDADLTVEVDPADAIVESDEGNNVATVPCETRIRGPLEVAFVEVRGGYAPPREFARTVARSREFLAATFPVPDPEEEGAAVAGLFHGAAAPGVGIVDDLLQVGLWGKLSDPQADRVLGIVSDDYFAYHGMPGAAGLTHLHSFVGLVREGSWTTAAHVLGHMHGITLEEFTLPACNPAEGYWVARHERIEGRVCFMCSGSEHDLDTHWVDTEHYRHLFESLGTPSTAPEVLLVSGFLDLAGTFEPSGWYLLPGGRLTESGPPGDHAVRILDGSGQVVSEVAFAVEFERNVESLGILPVDRVPLLVALTYPSDAATVQILSGSQTIASFSPSVRTLHTAVDAIPEDGFPDDAHVRRQSLHRQIDALQQLLDRGRARDAASLLALRIRPRILQWVLEEYEVAIPTQLTRAQVLAAVDAASVRIGNL